MRRFTKATTHRHAFLLAGALAFAFGCGGDGGGGMGGGADGGGGGGGGADGGGGGGGGGGDTDGGGGSNIEWPATPGDYAVELATYLNVLTIPELGDGNVPTCCKDFGAISKDNIEDGTDNLDNGLAVLADSVSLVADLQAEIDASIMAGDLVLLLDHRELDGDPDDFVMAQFVGAFANGTTFADADAGEGEFSINAASFADGTGEPQVYFDPANIDGGSVTAGPDQMAIAFPLQGAILDLVIHEAEVIGEATVGASSVTYSDGTLSGYITLDNFFGAINAILNSSQCDCLEKDGDVYFKDGNDWDSTCNNDASACPEDGVCETLGSGNFFSVCVQLPGFVNSAADIDLNDNPEDNYEAMSVGLQWTGVEASVTGVTQ